MSDREQTRSIELEIEVDASPEEVWKALTEADRLSSWFPLQARAERGKGGKVQLSWERDKMEWETTIDAWEPSAHLRCIDSPFPGENGRPVQLAVDFFPRSAGRKDRRPPGSLRLRRLSGMG